MLKKQVLFFFKKPSNKDNIPLLLPNLTINNHKIKQEESIKFQVVLLNENLTWKKHLKKSENKCTKNIGLLFKANQNLNEKCVLAVY